MRILPCEMWINMALLKCIIPDCKIPAKEEIKWMSDEPTQSVIHSSIKYEDKLMNHLIVRKLKVLH